MLLCRGNGYNYPNHLKKLITLKNNPNSCKLVYYIYVHALPFNLCLINLYILEENNEINTCF